MQFEFSLTSLQQRALAITMALIPILFVLFGVSSFVQAQIEHHERVSLLVRELNRYRAVIDEAPVWEHKLADIKSSPEWQNIFLPGSAATWANSVSQSPLASIITANGGTLLQSRTNAVTNSLGTAAQIDGDVTFTADITALTHILYAMRASGPLFAIHQLIIRDQEKELGGPRIMPNLLHVELRATGFGRPS